MLPPTVGWLCTTTRLMTYRLCGMSVRLAAAWSTMLPARAYETSKPPPTGPST
jgi:hypothetical protein